MSEAAERARLFVALELPDEARHALARWRSVALGDLPGIRPIAPGDLHVTLCFLGWRPVADLQAIVRACQSVADARAVELELTGAIWLPPRRPRVLAVRFSDAADVLATVQRRLSRVLASGGWYQPESRPFLAHATVARVARGTRVPARPLDAPPALRMRCPRVTLYRSRLHPSGARYEPIATVLLAGDQQDHVAGEHPDVG